MAEKKKQSSTTPTRRPNIEPLPAEKMLPARRLLLDAEPFDVEFRKLNEVAELIRLPDGLEERDKHARVVRAIEL